MIDTWMRQLGFDRRPPDRRPLRRVAAWALEATLLTIPWQGAITVGASRVAAVVGAVALVVAILAVLAGGFERWPAAPHWTLIGLTGVVALSWFWTINPDLALVRILTVVQLAGVTLLLWEFGSDPGQRRRFLMAFVLGAGIAVVLTIQSSLGASTEADFARFSSGESANPNDQGTVVALAIPLAWYLALTTTTNVRRLLLSGYVPLAVVGVAMTASRGAMLIAAVMVLGAALAGATHMTSGGVVAALLIAPICLGAVLTFTPDKALDRLATIQTEADGSGSLSDRDVLWPAGVEVFRDHPLTGVGVGGSRVAIERIVGREAGAHNAFISIAAELGVVGLVLFVATLVLIVHRIAQFPTLERRMGAALAVGVFLALLPLHWEYSKTLWVMLAVLIDGLAGARSDISRPTATLTA